MIANRGKLKGKEADVIACYTGGKTMKEIAEKFNVSDIAILKLLKKHSIPRRPKSNLNGQEPQVIQDYLSGFCVDELRKRYRISRILVNTILKDAEIPMRHRGDGMRKYAIDHSFFDIIDSEEKAYFLGFMYADGFNKSEKDGTFGLVLHAKDRAIVEAFRQAISSNAPLRYREKGGSVYCGLIIHSRHLSTRLTELGCMQAKTFKLVFPRWLDPSIRHHFIRGYFDGDGYISNTENQRFKSIISILGTDSFTETIAEILTAECRVSLQLKSHPRSVGIQMVNVRGNQQIKRVIEYLYRDATVYLERKKQRANAIFTTDFYKARGSATRPRVTPEQVGSIKDALLIGEASAAIAARFGVSKHVVYHIRAGRSGALY